MTLHVATHKLRDQVVVRLSGRLDTATAQTLHTHLDALIAGCVRPRIVVNLGGIGRIDAIGRFVLLEGLLQAQRAGGDLRLAAVTARVERELEGTRLNDVAEVYASVDEALFAALDHAPP